MVDKDLLFEKPSPITLAKAIKNKAELTGMQEAHLRDSVALAQTLHWLEQEVSHTRLLCSGLLTETLAAEQYLALKVSGMVIHMLIHPFQCSASGLG